MVFDTAACTSPAASMIGTAWTSWIQGMVTAMRCTSPPEARRIGPSSAVRRQPLSSALLPAMIWARSPVR